MGKKHNENTKSLSQESPSLKSSQRNEKDLSIIDIGRGPTKWGRFGDDGIIIMDKCPACKNVDHQISDRMKGECSKCRFSVPHYLAEKYTPENLKSFLEPPKQHPVF